MKPGDKFKLLLTRYLNDSLDQAGHDEFFRLLATGKYDHMLNSQLDTDIGDEDLNNELVIPKDIDLAAIINKTNEGGYKPDNTASTVNGRMHFGKIIVGLAAVIVLISVFSYLHPLLNKDSFFKDFVVSNSNKVINNSRQAMPVTLPDGSKIMLSSKSSLFFSLASFKNRREVYMQGDAKFDIKRDPSHPFYVFYGNITTKVLGTAFIIRTNPATKKIEVEVLRGKVQVYENEKTMTKKIAHQSVIVTPNQKSIYEPLSRIMETAIVDNPIPVAESEYAASHIVPPVFDFKEDKVSKVLNAIHDTYHIDIIVSNTGIYNCAFSGDITKATLYNKLKLVCTAISCDYHVSGTKIYIDGKGCN